MFLRKLSGFLVIRSNFQFPVSKLSTGFVKVNYSTIRKMSRPKILVTRPDIPAIGLELLGKELVLLCIFIYFEFALKLL